MKQSKTPRTFATVYSPNKAKGLACTDLSKTQQQYLEESDINTLLSKYQHHELAPTENGPPPIFGDFTDPRITDYMSAMNTINGVAQLMADLPAKVRDRFRNDPAQVLAFVADPRNQDEARELGMLQPEPEPPVIVPPEKK